MSKLHTANNSLSSNRDHFVPTWLYVKKCTHCGLMYFGKTITKDPVAYLGSGAYWKNHCNKYGWDKVRTLFTKLYDDPEKLSAAALAYSAKHDIVNAKMPSGKKLWANLKTEDGFDGGSVAGSLHKSSRKKMGSKHKGRTQYHDPSTGKEYKLLPDDPRIKKLKLVKGRTEATCKKVREAQRGVPKAELSLAKMAKTRKGQRPYTDGENYWLLRDGDPRIKAEGLWCGYPKWRAERSTGMLGKSHSAETRRLLSELSSKTSSFVTNNPMKNPEVAELHSRRMKEKNPSKGKIPYTDGTKNFFLEPGDPKIKKLKLQKGHVRLRWYYMRLHDAKVLFLKRDDPRIKRDSLVLCPTQ